MKHSTLLQFLKMADHTSKEMEAQLESGSDKDAYQVGSTKEGVTDATAGIFSYGIDAAHQKKVM